MPTDRPVTRGVAASSARRLPGLFALLVFVSGALSAVQSRANGTLSEVIGVSVHAALWSFGSGWALLTLGLIAPSARRGLVKVYRSWRARHLQGWQCLGGLMGGAFVGTQAFVVPVTGVALFLLAVVAGQTVNGLLVDRFGLGPGGRRAVTWTRVAWASLTIVGAALALSGGLRTLGPAVLAPVAVSMLVGAGLAVQAAVNGLVRGSSDSVIATTWMNFTWGCVFLAGLALGRAATAGPRVPGREFLGAPWWAYLGGLLGILFVSAVAVAVHHVGVLSVMLLTISGQLLGALGLDLASASTRHLVGAPLVTGVAVAILAAFASARAGRAARAAGGRDTRGGVTTVSPGPP